MPRLDPEYHKEVREYLRRMHATKEERDEAWYWVHHGVDIYDNPWFYYNDVGWPADLILAIRMDKDREEWFDSLTDEERAEYWGKTDNDGPSLEEFLMMDEEVT